ncbi:hypothetical protein ACIU1J_12340 [Azospirillum doebereinerae]|uniref:hypothetical protein n=1 Tax=Azospirillum doebereinerae TaxID=92933 RepID=UPI001EE52461|nr:hypothetical protein [Azospirillum doebereinerae]MCG5242256.1 hypothetical protein [Azospirillum doebereinerae]
MGISVPNISNANFSQFKGKTDKVAPSGTNAAYQSFSVSKATEFNFKINNTFTDVQILDQSNKVVAQIKSQTDVADASARLGPGTYTAVISQANKAAGVRDYSLDVSEKKNVLMTSGGAVLSATAQPPANGDSGVQKHTFNVVQGGTFTANMTLPNSRWALMGKDGKVVASSETTTPDEQVDFFKKPTYKIEPGEYQMIIVPSSKLAAATPFQMSFVPRDPTLQAAGTNQESAISKTLREREARLQQWAAQGSSTSTSA